MSFTLPGRHRSLAEFREHWLGLAPELGCDEEVLGAAGPLGQPFVHGDRVIGNRFAVHPMEGWDAREDGLPSADTLRRWRRFGCSGAKLIWGGEAFAVRQDGRANPNQLYLNPEVDVAAGLGELLDHLRGGHLDQGQATDDLHVGLQLTHSGRWSRPVRGERHPLIAVHHPLLDRRVGIDAQDPVLTDGELESIGEAFVQAAELAWKLGFNFVDVKSCHGYLLHELLGARARQGQYGGSFENRTRLFRRIVEAIGVACPGLEVAVRVSVCDSVPFHEHPTSKQGCPEEIDLPYRSGFGVDEAEPTKPDFAEPILFLELARDLGIRLANVTVGSPYYCPHLQRPAAYPPSDGYLPPEDPLDAVAYHLRAVRRCKAAVPELSFVGTGYSYLQEWLPHVAQHEVGAGHADFVGLGRMILSYPQMPGDILQGKPLDRRRICRTFSDCTTGPRNDMSSGCYPLDDHYKNSQEAQRLKVIKKGIAES